MPTKGWPDMPTKIIWVKKDWEDFQFFKFKAGKAYKFEPVLGHPDEILLYDEDGKSGTISLKDTRYIKVITSEYSNEEEVC
jgi:hypothetical protein